MLYLRHVQAERVERDEHPLIHHHRTGTVSLADVRVGRVAVDRVAASQVPWVGVDRRVYRHSRADPQHKHACYKSLVQK